MIEFQLHDIPRVVNVVLGSLTIMLMIASQAWWATQPRQVRIIMIAMSLLVVGITLGAAVDTATATFGGLGALVRMFGLFIALAAFSYLFVQRRKSRGPMPRGKEYHDHPHEH